jgi:hypothetical protein
LKNSEHLQQEFFSNFVEREQNFVEREQSSQISKQAR